MGRDVDCGEHQSQRVRLLGWNTKYVVLFLSLLVFGIWRKGEKILPSGLVREGLALWQISWVSPSHFSYLLLATGSCCGC